MKKLFTLCLLASSIVMSAKTTNLWTGSTTFGAWSVTEGVQPAVEASAFENAKVGDEIVIAVAYDSAYEDSWHAVQIWCWGATNENIYDQQVLPETTEQTYTINEEGLASLKGYGMAIGGAGIIVTSVNLTTSETTTPPTAESTTLWTGSTTFGAWSVAEGVQPAIEASAFENAKVGDEIVIAVAYDSAYEDSWHAVQIWCWGATNENIYDQQVLPETTEQTYTINEEGLASLKGYGMAISGAGIIVTAVTLVSKADGDDDGPSLDDGSVLWSGSFTPSWSEPLYIDKSKCTNVKSGDFLVFAYENCEDGDVQIAVDYNGPAGWTPMPNNGEGDWGNYLHLVAGSGTVEFAVNNEAAEIMKEYGVMLAGQGSFILTKVMLTEKVTTAVSDVMAPANSNQAVYNLFGIKVADSVESVRTPGIYVAGGKKFIVK